MSYSVILEVLDSNNAQYDSFRLNVNDVNIQINRNPIVAALPRSSGAFGPEGNLPNAFVVDLGMMQEIIIISGVCKDAEKDLGVASIAQLCSVVRGGWFGITSGSVGTNIGITGGIGLNIDMGTDQVQVNGLGASTPTNYGTVQRFQGAIQAFQANRVGGSLYWEFKLTLIVGSWPRAGDSVAPGDISAGPMYARTRNTGNTSNSSTIGFGP